ncbi:MAG: protoporphyrinogen oxidase-like protein [Caldisericales bacterium]|nr:protoporphyrinogen oxidase-like protein [Caldisericales bacterium]
MNHQDIILGAGVTGLAAGFTSRLPIYEAAEKPGGICCSYYMHPKENKRLFVPPNDDEAYRFELGGGHWIWGGDSVTLRFLRTITPFKIYTREAAVFLPDKEIIAAYPIQSHLRHLGPELAAKALKEMFVASRSHVQVTTMAEWLKASFGPTLYELFFEPFHELYTSGLHRRIAPQDAHKSPVDLNLIIEGAFKEIPPVGYNTTFIYPEYGLNALVQNMAKQCEIRYGKRAVRIDVNEKIVYFEDRSKVKYHLILSTLPLNQMIDLTGLDVGEKPDPYTSVLVVNIGAIKGPSCPKEHWLYIPRSLTGFHRVGFYSNVDVSFLPASARHNQDKVSIYVEKCYLGRQKPNDSEIEHICCTVVKELQEWGWIRKVEVVDPTWVDVGYTWSWPGSRWREKALKALEMHDIYQIGRFAKWLLLNGISDSINDGLVAGAAFGSFYSN